MMSSAHTKMNIRELETRLADVERLSNQLRKQITSLSSGQSNGAVQVAPRGSSPVTFTSNTPGTFAISAEGTGVSPDPQNIPAAGGVYASSDNFMAVLAVSGAPDNPAVYAFNNHDDPTVPGGAPGVFSDSINGVAIQAHSHNAAGVSAQSDHGHGIDAFSGDGFFEDTRAAYAIRCGTRDANGALTAYHLPSGHAVYLAGAGAAGYFTGNVYVDGSLQHSSAGSILDHPSDPANKYLTHTSVESSEMKNVYDGVIEADSDGKAAVELPPWVEVLNDNFRYQLTPIGSGAPNLHVAEGLHDNRFVIAGATPGMKISWQVTGVRKDRWAKKNTVPVEIDKPEEERGYYVHPELYGHGSESSVSRIRIAAGFSRERERERENRSYKGAPWLMPRSGD